MAADRPETFYCFACGCTHDGRSFREGDALFGQVSCPKLGTRVFPLSSDADLFASFREGMQEPAVARRWHLALLHITDRCSMRCPTCFAESGDGPMLSYDEVMRQARQTVARGVHKLTLTGGEPSEHPDVLRIIHALRYELGASVSLLTNGRRLGEEPGFAAALKAAGLRKVHISFDTLVPATSVRMRGADYIDLKKRAFASAAAAGLTIAANVTVSEANLDEIGTLFRHLSATVPGLTHVLFQPLSAMGRGNLTGRIDRERILKTLAASADFPLDEARDFMPMPRVPAFGIDLHPDCGALSAVLVRGEGAATTLRALDAGGRGRLLARRLAAVEGRPGVWASVRALAAWARYAGLAGLPLIGRWWRGGRGAHVVLAVVDNLPEIDFMLAERIRRCCSAVVCRNGEFAPICAGYCSGRKGALL